MVDEETSSVMFLDSGEADSSTFEIVVDNSTDIFECESLKLVFEEFPEKNFEMECDKKDLK